MARFVYVEHDYGEVIFEAEPGEEIPLDQAQVWAQVALANATSFMARSICDLTDAVSGLRRD